MSEIRDLLERTRPVLLGSCCIYTKVHLHVKEQEFMKYSERNQDKVNLVCNFHQLCNTNLTLLWVLTSKHRSFYPRDESINFKSDQEYYLLIMCGKPKQNWKEMKSAVPVQSFILSLKPVPTQQESPIDFNVFWFSPLFQISCVPPA